MCATYFAVVGDTDRSAAIAGEAVALARQSQDQRTLSVALAALGYTSVHVDPERARTSFREVVGIGDRWCTASALWGLGWIDDLAGNAGGAVRCYREALEIWNETGDRRGIFYAIQGVAIVAARTGAHTSAVRLFAGAETIGPDVGSGSMPEWNVWRDQHLEELRDALTAADFAVSWAAGERLDSGVLVKEALMAARQTECDAAETTP
jgi:hypothetical protein